MKCTIHVGASHATMNTLEDCGGLHSLSCNLVSILEVAGVNIEKDRHLRHHRPRSGEYLIRTNLHCGGTKTERIIADSNLFTLGSPRVELTISVQKIYIYSAVNDPEMEK